MADEQPQAQTPDDGYNAGQLQSSYSKFYVARPSHQVDINTKVNIQDPSIRADFNKAAAGTDVVSDNEMTGLTWQRTRVYRGNPTDTNDAADISPDMKALMSLMDRKQLLNQWGEPEVAEENRLVKKIAAAANLDEEHVRWMERSYENAIGNAASTFDPQAKDSPAKRDMAALLTKQASGFELSADESTRMTKDIAAYMKENNYNAATASTHINQFDADVRKLKPAALKIDTSDVQERKSGWGEAFYYGSGTTQKYANVMKVPGDDERAHFTACDVWTPDLPDHPPPYSKEAGEFLVSLHEAQHITRQDDIIAQQRDDGKGPQYKGMTADSVGLAQEIDADRAVTAYLDQQHEPAAKAYYLQQREVDSFAYGIPSGDLGHDTATFLRVYEKTGKEIDLDAFTAEKKNLFTKINAKVSLETNDVGRAKVGDIMGATQDLLAEDKAQKDPSKKLSAMQRAEAESFLKDATAMGYHANPDYPKPPAQAAAPKPMPAIPPPPMPPKA